MRGVFLDSVGLLALWNASDQWHPAAAKTAHRRVFESDEPMWTTTLVLYECGNRAAQRAEFRGLVVAFWDEIGVGRQRDRRPR